MNKNIFEELGEYAEGGKVACICLEQKLYSMGISLEDKEQFEKDIIKRIKASMYLSNTAVLSTAETLFNLKNGSESLADIFFRHNIDLKGYIFSITVRKKFAIIADGFGNGKNKVEVIDNKLRYSVAAKVESSNMYI